MKIKRFKILKSEQRPLLNNLELCFEGCSENRDSNPNCFIGVNGSGKSQYLESIAEVFLYLDKRYRKIDRDTSIKKAPLSFEIEYDIVKSDKIINIEILQTKEGLSDIEILVTEDGNLIDISNDELEYYLPEKIVGYTSGENETISMPFYSYFDTYAIHTAERAFDDKNENDYEPRFYFMDYSTNLGIIIGNLVFENGEHIKRIKSELKIESLKSFQITIQTYHTEARKKFYKGKRGISLTKELESWRKKLIKCSTCYKYDESNECYTLDFYLNDSTKKAFVDHFGSSKNLYTALYKFELLNNLMVDKQTREGIARKRKQRKLTARMPTVPDKDKVLHYSELKLKLENGQIIDYLNLSDGEHQYFNIFGTLLMMDQSNTLFLLDEPETHFNPYWRRYFISTMKEILNGRNQDVFVTSHSPFIVSDTPSESVYIFKRIDKNRVEVVPPRQETFGATFNNILKMAFELDETISDNSLKKINELLEENDPEIIKNEINKLGDSPLLMSLYRRMNTLLKKQE